MQIWVLLVLIIIIIYLYYADYRRWLRINETIMIYVMTLMESVNRVYRTPYDDSHVSQVQDVAANDPPHIDTKEQLARQMIVEGVQNAEQSAECVDPCATSIESDDAYRMVNDATFAEWTDHVGIDPAVRVAHNDWVEERMGDPQTQMLGTSRPIDRHDTYDAIPWQGLMRPTRVDIESPDQIADLDYNRYAAQKRVRWTSDTYQ